MEVFLKVLPYLANLASGVILACATYTINKARKGHEDAQAKAEEHEKALSEGVQALLRESIVSSYNKHAEKGFCPIYAKESAKRCYKAYSKLGGNDVAHELYDKILKMPTEPEV